ncbi:MAG: DUF664 domain-containing protein [Mycobacteriales bacterium]
MATEVGDVRWFIDVACDGMVEIVSGLGDEGANVRPLPGSNSPYCLLAHCLGVTAFWAGHAIAGRTIDRDRPAEFRAAGPVAPLLERVVAVRQQLDRDLEAYQAESPPRQSFEDDSLPAPLTQRGCLLHLYEELARHHGQMEILRDAIEARA